MDHSNIPSWVKSGPYFVFGFGVLRLLLLVMAVPLVGFGNNYDFNRQSACVGLWHYYDGQPKVAMHVDGPVNRLKYDGDIQPDLCLRSIDDVFPWLSTKSHSMGDVVDLREIGLLKSFFVVSAFCVAVFSVPSLAFRYAGASLFFLVFGDLAVISYFNTLYSEVSVLIGACLSLLFLLGLAHLRDRPPVPFLVIGVLGLVWLGLSKQQYLALAILFGGSSAWIVWQRWRMKKFAVVVAVAACICPLTFLLSNSTERPAIRDIELANATNAYLGAVLPFAQDKARAVALLGLPARCVAAIGVSWYTPGVQSVHPCPEVRQIGRWRLLPLFLFEPRTFFKPMYRAAVWSWPAYPTTVGMVEAPTVTHRPAYRFVRGSSLSSLITVMAPRGYAMLLLGGGMIGLMFGAYQVFSRHRLFSGTGSAFLSHFLYFLAGGVIVFSLGSAMFGDGYSDAPKHSVLLIPGAACLLIALCSSVLEVHDGARVPTNKA